MPKTFSLLNKFIINMIIEGVNPKIIIKEIIIETNCQRNFKLEFAIPEENFTIDCPNNIMDIIAHSVL